MKGVKEKENLKEKNNKGNGKWKGAEKNPDGRIEKANDIWQKYKNTRKYLGT